MQKFIRVSVVMVATTVLLIQGTSDRRDPPSQSGRVYMKSAEPWTPSPSAWPSDHDSLTNNSVFDPGFPANSPDYLVALPALANSAPVWVGDHLYVAGGFVTGPRHRAHPGFVWALNPGDGRLQWSLQTPNSVFAAPIVANHRLLVGVGNAVFARRSSSPATTPGMVRGVGPSGLYAYNATTGEPLWTLPTTGADQAPATVVGHTVYLASGNRRFYALSLQTGHVDWSIDLGHYVSRSSPRVLGHYAYMGGAGPLGVLAVNLKTHTLAWDRPLPEAIQGLDDTPMAVTPDRLITAALTKPSRNASDRRRDAATLYALNPTTGATVWSRTLADGPAPQFKATGTPTVNAGVVYTGNALNGRVVAVSLQSGTLLWSIHVGAPVTRPPAVMDDRVEVLTKTGDLVTLSLQGKMLNRIHLGHWVNTYGPIIDGGSIALTGNTAQTGYLAVIPRPGNRQRSIRHPGGIE